MNFLKRYIGDKVFYLRTFRIAIPLALQMLLQSCMGIIDTMMVSSIGMVTAVGNASQILMLHDGISWGAISGISMFAAQFFGAKQNDNLKKTFDLSIVLGLVNAFFWIFITYAFGHEILLFYLNDIEVVVNSKIYLDVAILALIPFAINNSFGALFRSMHMTKLNLYISITGALFNVALNALFIFGFKVGVVGAAWGTLLSQSIMFVIYLTYSLKTKQVFIDNLFNCFKLHFDFVKPILSKMIPLMINETLFGFGMTLFIKAFGMLGTQSMDAYYVSNQIFNLFLFAIYGYGSAVSILIGTRLGQGRIELAKEESKYQIGLGFIIGIIMLIAMDVFAKPMVGLFGYTSGITYQLAIGMVYVLSFKLFLRMFNFMMFSTLRAGGDTKILNFLDSGIMYLIGLPLAFVCVYLFDFKSIVLVLAICQIEQLVRLVFTIKRYNECKWAVDLTSSVH